MKKGLNRFAPIFLTICVLALPMAADPSAVTTVRPTVVHPESALHREYRGFSSRLAALDERIGANVNNHIYTAQEAAKLHAGLEAIRARFRNIANRTRWLSAAQRAQINSDIKAQELRISGANNP